MKNTPKRSIFHGKCYLGKHKIVWKALNNIVTISLIHFPSSFPPSLWKGDDLVFLWITRGKPTFLPQIVLLGIISTTLVQFVHEGDCSRLANLINWLWKFLNPSSYERLTQFYLANLNWINRNLKFICSPFEGCIKISRSSLAWTIGL